MRAIAHSILAGTLLLWGCGSANEPQGSDDGEGGDDTSPAGGSGGKAKGGSGGSAKGGAGGKASGSQGGSGGVGSGGTPGGEGGTPAAGGSAGSAAGGGGGETPAPPDAGGQGGAPVTTPTGGANGFGGLGPDSADDSPPLVLPGSHLIFDGKTMTGWNCDAKWSVKDGAIDGTGSGNSFCKTVTMHDTFRITGKSRIVKDPSNHAGICFWPIGNSFLQITPVSGSLWDYRGGGGVRTLPRIYPYTEWNFFELLVDAKTGTVDLAVEGHGFPTFTDKKAHPKGPIALQLHAQPNEVQYKDLAVEDNPTVMKLLTIIPGK